MNTVDYTQKYQERKINPYFLSIILIITTGVAGSLMIYLITGDWTTLKTIDYESAITSSLKYLGSWVGVYITYHFTYHYHRANFTKQPAVWNGSRYVICIIACAFIGWIWALELGTHVEDADPLYGGGNVVQDFIPTEAQQVQHGLTVFLGTLVPALLGLHQGVKDAFLSRAKDSTQ